MLHRAQLPRPCALLALPFSILGRVRADSHFTPKSQGFANSSSIRHSHPLHKSQRTQEHAEGSSHAGEEDIVAETYLLGVISYSL